MFKAARYLLSQFDRLNTKKPMTGLPRINVPPAKQAGGRRMLKALAYF